MAATLIVPGCVVVTTQERVEQEWQQSSCCSCSCFLGSTLVLGVSIFLFKDGLIFFSHSFIHFGILRKKQLSRNDNGLLLPMRIRTVLIDWRRKNTGGIILQSFVVIVPMMMMMMTTKQQQQQQQQQ